MAGKDLLAYNASLDRFRSAAPSARDSRSEGRIPGSRFNPWFYSPSSVPFTDIHLASETASKIGRLQQREPGAQYWTTHRWATIATPPGPAGTGFSVYDAALQQVRYMARVTPSRLRLITYQDGRLWASGEGNRVYVWSPDGTGSQPRS